MSANEELAARVGLCARCIHARTVETRSATYWRCALAASDPRFAKYPRLPVVECAGFRVEADGSDRAPDRGTRDPESGGDSAK